MMPTPPANAPRCQAEELLRQVSAELLVMIQAILDHSGYGSVTITLKKGGVDELAMRVTAKPRQKKISKENCWIYYICNEWSGLY